LSEEQIANAIGCCASGNVTLQILDSNTEEFGMRKNLRFGAISYSAILYCLLAKKGFSGPVRVVEGDNGWKQVLAKGELDLGRMTDFSGWRILEVRHKTLCTNGTNHGSVLATLAIVKEQNLQPEDIAAVRLKIGQRQTLHGTAPAKKYPRNAETADHSTHFTNAIAIKERALGPDQFTPEKFSDPVVLDLVERITVETDTSIPGREGAICEITTKDGRKFEKKVVTPHGRGDDPLSDREIEYKFKDMANRYMDEQQMQQIIDTVWDTEKLDDMNQLMRLMVFKSSSRR
jgi:2-methylcitrate dehydratase